MYGVMEQKQPMDFTWSCMLYGTPEDLKPKLPYAILLGFLLRRDVHSDLHKRYRSFANVLLVAEGCVDELDLKALARLWSIREVRLPKVTKKTEEEGLPHRQANGVKTADALLQMFAMELDCRTCLVSDIEVHIKPGVIAEQFINLRTAIDDRQFQSGAVFCVQQEQNFLDLENTAVRPGVQGERSYAFAIFKSQPTLSKTLQKLLTHCMTSSQTKPQQDNMNWMTLFVKIFEPEHDRLPRLMALVPAWINNPNT
jgi:hypothetical protein